MNMPLKKSQEAGEHSYWHHTGEEYKHFFKVMIGEFHERMTIPDGFVQHFSGATEQTIKLESHSGYTFDAQVTWNLEKLVLESGWKEFASAHDLRMGDFLVFKYDGNSLLKVLVFSPTGCEKTLACDLMKNAAPGEERWRNPAGILSTCRDLPMKFPQSGNQASAHWDISGQENNIITISSSSAASESAGDTSLSEDDHEVLAVPNCILTRGTLLALNEVQKKQLEEKIQAVYSGIPIFGCVIRKSNICGKPCILDISRKYAEVYLPFEDQMLTLQRHGQKWKVWCRITACKSIRFSRGWKQFAHDNKLQLGDACLFELLKNEKYVMNVHIIGKSLHKRRLTPGLCEKTSACDLMKTAAPGKERWRNPAGIRSTFHDLPMKFAQSGRQTSAHPDSSMLGNIISISSSRAALESAGDIPSSEDDLEAHDAPSRILARGTLLVLNQVQKDQLEETIQDIHSEIPIYGCVVRKSTISGKTRTLEISREYAEVYLPFEEKMLTLQNYGKKWEVRCCVKGRKSKRFLRGWKQFAHDNSLQLGDVCLFELLNRKNKYAMNVHIIRKSLRRR